MKMIQPDEFEEFYKKGKTIEEYIETTENENEESAKRLKFYHKRAKVPEHCKQRLSELTYPQKIAIIGANWCWDCQTNIGAIFRIAECTDRIETKIFKKEEHMDLSWKINGGEKIPIVHFFSGDGYYVSSWVERPAMTYQLYGDLRKKLGWDIDIHDFAKEYKQIFLERQDELLQAVIKEISEIILKIEMIFRSSPRLNKKM